MSSGVLKREVGLLGAFAYGVGIIVGAGVYALIGRAAGHAGNSVWMSFILAAVVASFTGLSYAELSSMFQESGAEYVYVEKAFGKKFLAFIVGWLVLLSGVVSSSAVALGFAGYLFPYVRAPETVLAVMLIAALSLVNLRGIQESVRVNIVLTLTEVLGLVLIVLLGIGYYGSVNYFDAPFGARGIVSSAALVFFAFIGFEALVKIGEETRDPKRTIPRALMLSLVISTILYAMVALSVVSILPYDRLAFSESPLADVAMKAGGQQAYLALSVIALFATANTVLIILIATSRILYGMARDLSQSLLSRIHERTGTPYMAVLFTMIGSVVFVLIGDIELVANVTNFATFLVFLAVNLALIVLRRRESSLGVFPGSGLNLMGVPFIAVLGAVSSFLMLLQFDLAIVAIAAAVLGFGAIFYRLAT
jgi:APA family basic amino acid/polyamine antiporter